ncbi:hypothetical protein CLOM_g6211 [Closterium sp. NIES-68]|nr:hypothetical protein CLOM_g6211 [Closterium sp. NIES-68]GJP66596.1 hypothetical protein CLOP_g23511 [Closterium sp. NIES-67]
MASQSILCDTGLVELDLPLPDAITAADAAGIAAIAAQDAAGPEGVKLLATACGAPVCSDYKEAIYDLANASWRQLGDVCVMNNTLQQQKQQEQQKQEKEKEKEQEQEQEQEQQEEFSFFQFPVVPQRTRSLPLAERPCLVGEGSPLGNGGWAASGAAGAAPDWRDMSAAEEVRCAAMREQGYCLFARGGGVCSPGGLGGFSVPVQ